MRQGKALKLQLALRAIVLAILLVVWQRSATAQAVHDTRAPVVSPLGQAPVDTFSVSERIEAVIAPARLLSQLPNPAALAPQPVELTSQRGPAVPKRGRDGGWRAPGVALQKHVPRMEYGDDPRD